MRLQANFMPDPYSVELIAGGEEDARELAPDGWYCNDDAYAGYQPAVEFGVPQSGEYLIWVGTYEAGQGSATLFISVVDPR